MKSFEIRLKVISLVCGCAFAMASGAAWALTPGQRVQNFKLSDEAGKSYELYALKDRKVVVLMTQGNGCPIARLAMPPLRDVRAKYDAKDAMFFLINSNLQDDRESVAAEAKEFAFDMPVLLDGKQTVGEALHFTRTAEVLVIRTQDWKLMYRGPIDDRLGYERQRAPQEHYLQDALSAVLAGQPVKRAKVDAPGCLINFPERDRRAADAHADNAHVAHVH